MHFVTSEGSMQDMFLSRTMHSFSARVWGWSENIRHYFSLKVENDKLAEENFNLRQEVLRLKKDAELQYVDSIARSIAGISEVDNFRYMPATILKISSNSQHNYIILGQGSEDGVIVGSGIITENGVVGIVNSVDKHCSYALSFLNSGVSISSRIGTDGAIGPLSWDGKGYNGAILKNIPLQNKVEKGDTVYTSGHSSFFPPDIPIGVTGDSRIVNGATYEIDVSLFQSFKRIKYVTLASNTALEEIERLETDAVAEKKKK